MDYRQKYIKYKHKYTKLLGQYKGGAIDNITIDSINFKLVGYNLKNEVIDKDSLKIISTLPDGTTYELYLYQSETSLGFWRLGCHNRVQLYKGENDYIQQTFIHFILQEFINKNIEIVKSVPFVNIHPELTEENKKKIIENDLNLYKNNFPICWDKLAFKNTFNHYIPQHIIDPNRMIKIEPFLTFNKDLSKLCGNWKKDPRTDLQELSTKFSEHYQLDRSSINLLYNNVYEYNNEEFDGSPIQLNVNYEIFICKLISRIDSSELFLYYTIYNIINKDSLIADRQYFPLFLTTNLHITPFGTFEKYVLSGGYICKLFEYQEQVKIPGFGARISKEHLYIGYIYNNLFPFNEIKLH